MWWPRRVQPKVGAGEEGVETGLAPARSARRDPAPPVPWSALWQLTGRIDRRLTQQQVPLIRPAWLTALPRGEALVRLRGEVWKLRVPLLDPPPPDALARLGLADVVTTLKTAARPSRSAA